MKIPFLAASLCLLALPASAQSLQLAGKFGYLSEYELSADVALAEGATDYSGPLTVKHVGLCSHDGPQQVSGEIRLQVAKTSSHIKATLVFDGRRCTFSGALSENTIGEMICPGVAVPASLWSNSK